MPKIAAKNNASSVPHLQARVAYEADVIAILRILIKHTSLEFGKTNAASIAKRNRFPSLLQP
jgi:hypothetical protein